MVRMQVVANAGDSRAVLSTAGKAVDLSSDHKPHTDAERRRIKAAGGIVCPEDRIGGELTVSRAIGAPPPSPPDFSLPARHLL